MKKIKSESILKNWDVIKTTIHGDKLWKETGFFKTMEPYEAYFEVFEWAYENYECYIATTSPHHVLSLKK